MSLRVVPVSAPLGFLLFLSTFVVAQVNVTANCTLSSFSWTFNSLGQSPCLVAAYMLSTCNRGSYGLVPLPKGYVYPGPEKDFADKCQCSTVGYSLMAACTRCQGTDPLSYNTYVSNCTDSLLPPSQFPNPVPAGIRVPHWVILDVTNENYWNAGESQAAGGNEYSPGAIINGTAVSTSSMSASSSSTGTPSPTPGPRKGKTSNPVKIIIIVCSVVGVLAVAIFLAILYYCYCLPRRHRQAASPGSAVVPSQAMQIAQSPPDSPHNQDDPTDEYQSLLQVAQDIQETRDIQRTTSPGHQGGTLFYGEGAVSMAR